MGHLTKPPSHYSRNEPAIETLGQKVTLSV